MGDDIRTASLEITPEILRLIAEIDEFKGAWTAIGRISPDRLDALRRIAITGALMARQQRLRRVGGLVLPGTPLAPAGGVPARWDVPAPPTGGEHRPPGRPPGAGPASLAVSE